MKTPAVYRALPGPYTEGWYPAVPTDITTLRAFLAHFPQNQKSTVANLFLAPVRRGIRTPEGVRAAVYAELRESVERAASWGRANERDQFILDTMRLDYDGSLDYARYAIVYEQMTTEEKARIKAGRAQEGIDAWMDRQEPTEKQIVYLRSRGYTGTIDSRRHASALIDIYMRGGRVEANGVV